MAGAEEASPRAIECMLVTRGRTSGEPRAVTLWFAAVTGGPCCLAERRRRGGALGAQPAGGSARSRSRGRGAVVRGAGARVAADEAEDPLAREAIAAKYGTTGLKTWLRTSLPVAIDLEDRPTGERGAASGDAPSRRSRRRPWRSRRPPHHAGAWTSSR